MSPLPQRKKSAEELAQLRESLGMGQGPGNPAPVPPVPAPVENVNPARWARPSEALPLPAPVAPVHPVPTVPSDPGEVVPVLKGEMIPVLDPQTARPVHLEDAAVIPHVEIPLPARHQVRSLRKSEQGPVRSAVIPASGSTLPIQRHSDDDLRRIRRAETLGPHPRPPLPIQLTAHPVVVIPGYLLAIAGAMVAFVARMDWWIPASCVALAATIGIGIFFTKPLSRHHAAFILVLVFVIAVFGAIQYIPEFHYGT